MSNAIQIEKLSKKYLIRHQRQERYTALRDVIMDRVKGLGARLRTPFFRRKEPADIEDFWALKDIGLNIEQGDCVGIIGRNGAGKSTLLKILSRITEPTTGRVTLNGRVSSLLEVGTGFHPELTGRENIFLNGAILGMSRSEIKKNFDQIVDFAEVEKFLDTPVKRYSSGMYVRLAFAVAAHLEPEILIVDEVLAVGDAQFQKKCLGKMESVGREGRTVLFVSHNMAAVQKLCTRSVLLDEGRVCLDGPSSAVVESYLKDTSFSSNDSISVKNKIAAAIQSEDIKITDIYFLNKERKQLDRFYTYDTLTLHIRYKAKRQVNGVLFSVQVRNDLGTEIIRLNTTPISGCPIDKVYDEGYVELVMESLPLTGGRYYFDVGIAIERVEWLSKLDGILTLEVSPKDVYGSGVPIDSTRGVMVVKHQWHHSKK